MAAGSVLRVEKLAVDDDIEDAAAAGDEAQLGDYVLVAAEKIRNRAHGVGRIVSRDAVGDGDIVAHGITLAQGSYTLAMAQITLRGNPVQTSGELPEVGSAAPGFSLVSSGFAPITDADYAGRTVVLNIFPSVDTPTCAASVRTFNERASALEGAEVLCVSADLPPAAGRFCGAEGIENVACGSTFRNPEVLDAFGVRITDGPLEGLAARAVVVIDGDGRVVHSQLVSEIADEPDYDAALAAIA